MRARRTRASCASAPPVVARADARRSCSCGDERADATIGATFARDQQARERRPPTAMPVLFALALSRSHPARQHHLTPAPLRRSLAEDQREAAAGGRIAAREQEKQKRAGRAQEPLRVDGVARVPHAAERDHVFERDARGVRRALAREKKAEHFARIRDRGARHDAHARRDLDDRPQDAGLLKFEPRPLEIGRFCSEVLERDRRRHRPAPSA